jgi:hypothetical protein
MKHILQQTILSTLLLIFMTIGHISAQTFNYGTGSVAGNAAPFAAGDANVIVSGNDVTVTGNTNMTAGTYNFGSFTINAGVTVTVTGTGAPLIIKCTGAFVNNGILSVNGANGATPPNGTTATNPTPIVTGIAGGSDSGRGGGPANSGTANRATGGSSFGTSTGGGRTPCNSATYTVPSWGGPGGGGGIYGVAAVAANNGANGAGQGTGCATGGGAGTAIYGDATLTTQAGAAAAFFSPGQTPAGDRWLLGGSGGAGGAGTQSLLPAARAAGGSGGTGGGAVQITANSIYCGPNGIIRARGGNGGNGNLSSGGNAAGGGGGGGSGGTINLQYMTSYVNDNTNTTLRIDVRGGLGGAGLFGTTGTGGDGGAGGAGRVLIEQDVVLCTPPTVSATSFGASGITTNSATLSWTRGNGDQVLVIVREGSAVSGGPVSATSYTANSNFTLGEALGGGRVVYIGSGTSVNVTNLPNLNTTYHVAVFEFFTAGGGCYQNLASALTGTFTTSNGPMTYVSSTNVQQTGNSPLGSTNQAILRLEVVGGPGTAPALTVSGITFNTTGTTNTADINGARIYYTGSSTTFAATTQFGTQVDNPSGSHVVSGSQVLAPGVNYFWLVYDVSIGATVGNVMDAQITSVNTGSAQTPLVTNPAGNRTITSLMSLSCGYNFTHFTPTWVSNVTDPTRTTIASGPSAIDDQRWPGQSFASGFTFEFNGTVYNSFGIHSKGYIWFGATTPLGLSFTPISSTLGYEGAIAPFAFDMVAHINSTNTPEVSVRYTGTAPNRVCIIEWTAFRPWNNTGGFCTLFSPQDWNRYDFQLHLYENGGTNANRIEFVYRDMNPFCVDGNGASAQVGLRGASNTDFLNRTGSGNNAHTASSAGTANTQTITHGSINYFNENGGMRFTPTFQIPLVTPSPTASNVCPALDVQLSTTSPVATKQWYRNNLPITGATASTYNADQTGNHIVVVTQSGCSKVSEVVAVTITPCGVNTWTGLTDTDWNTPSNWTIGVPALNSSVEIPNTINKPTITGVNPVLINITIDPLATLTIASNASLTVSGVITNNGTVTVNSGGALVQTATSTLNPANTGTFQIRRQLPGSNNGFRYMGSPIEDLAATAVSGISATGTDGAQIIPLPGCNISAIAANSPFGNILELRENPATVLEGCAQSLWHVKSAGNLENGRAYAMRGNGGQTISFNGNKVNNDIVNFSGLTRQAGTITDHLTGGVTRGWHLVANPYPSPIVITGASDLVPQGFDGQIQLYNAATGVWEAPASPSTPVTIAVGQGFQIRKTTEIGTATLSFNNGMRQAITGAQFFDADEWYQYMIKAVVSGNNMNDQTIVFFHPDATTSFDPTMDVNKMTGPVHHPMLFTMAGIERMAYNGLPLLSAPISVDMRFYPGTAGNYTLSFESLETMPGTAMIYLEDKKTGVWTNLRQQSIYSFQSALSDNIQRFVLHFEPPLHFNVSDETCAINDGSIEIINPSNETWSIELNNQSFTISQGALLIDGLAGGDYTINLSNQSLEVQETVMIAPALAVDANFNIISGNTINVSDMVSASVSNVEPNTDYQWFINELFAGNGSEVQFMITEPGAFTLVLEARRASCFKSSAQNITVEGTTLSSGIMFDQDEISLFPNPAKDVVNIIWRNGIRQNETVVMSDISGRVISKINAGDNQSGSMMQLDVSDLSPGIYIVNIEKNNSRKSYRLSVVK